MFEHCNCPRQKRTKTPRDELDMNLKTTNRAGESVNASRASPLIVDHQSRGGAGDLVRGYVDKADLRDFIAQWEEWPLFA